MHALELFIIYSWCKGITFLIEMVILMSDIFQNTARTNSKSHVS